jgi:hypothetical protein
MLDLSPEIVKMLTERVRNGEWPEKAALRIGLTRSQLRAWVASGEENEDRWHMDDPTLTEHQNLCATLVYRILVAEADCEERWIREWQAAVAKSAQLGRAISWQGYPTLLERRFPDRWRKRELARAGEKAESPEDEFRRITDPEVARKALEGG